MKIKNLYVKVIYHVGLSDVEVSDELYEALQHLADCGTTSDTFLGLDEQVNTATEWLGDNICEDDACDLEYEITDMDE